MTAAGKILVAEAKIVSKTATGGQIPHLAVEHSDRNGGKLGEALQIPLASAQGFFGLPAPGDIQNDAEKPDHPPRRIPKRPSLRHEPPHRAFGTGTGNAELDVQFGRASGGLRQCLLHRVPVVRMNRIDPCPIRGPAAVRFESEKRPQLGGPDVPVGFEVPFPRACFRRVEGQKQALLALAHGLPRPLAIAAVAFHHGAGDEQQNHEAAVPHPQNPPHAPGLGVSGPASLGEQRLLSLLERAHDFAVFVHDPPALAGANQSQGGRRVPAPAQGNGVLQRGELAVRQPGSNVQQRLLLRVVGSQLTGVLPQRPFVLHGGFERREIALVSRKEVAALFRLRVLEVRQQSAGGVQNLVRVRYPALTLLLHGEIDVQHAGEDGEGEKPSGEQAPPAHRRSFPIRAPRARGDRWFGEPGLRQGRTAEQADTGPDGGEHCKAPDGAWVRYGKRVSRPDENVRREATAQGCGEQARAQPAHSRSRDYRRD